MEHCGSAKAQCPTRRGRQSAELARRGIPLLAARPVGPGRRRTTCDRPNLDLPAPSCSTVRSAGQGVGRSSPVHLLDPHDALAVLDIFERRRRDAGRQLEPWSGMWSRARAPSWGKGGCPTSRRRVAAALVDDLRAMVAALPVYAFSVVACPEEAALRAVRDDPGGGRRCRDGQRVPRRGVHQLDAGLGAGGRGADGAASRPTAATASSTRAPCWPSVMATTTWSCSAPRSRAP